MFGLTLELKMRGSQVHLVKQGHSWKVSIESGALRSSFWYAKSFFNVVMLKKLVVKVFFDLI
jgi:hypothetical protein